MTRLPTIVCVDDEAVVRSSLKDQLRRVFDGVARVEVAGSGEEALELLDELEEEGGDLPVVISDQIMPGMKGDELLVEIHRRLPRTLTVLLTGQASAEAVGNAVNRARLYRYIGKPWDREDLNLTVREAFRSYHLDKRLDEQNRELLALNEKLERRTEAFFRFVPREFLNILNVSDYEDVRPEIGTDREMAILFADIRDFTTMCEGLTPAQCVQFINGYLTHMAGPIMENQGVIQGFFGDGIMALFDSSASAVRAGVEMTKGLARFNEERAARSLRPIRIGVGINTGRITLAVLGSHGRVSCNVAGDHVNLASRVETLTKSYSAVMLVSHNTVERLPPDHPFTLRQVDRVAVKGRRSAIELYQVLDAEPPDQQALLRATLPTYRQAVTAYYRAEFLDAGRAFAEALVAHPADQNALAYLSRCAEHSARGVDGDWDGVERLSHK